MSVTKLKMDSKHHKIDDQTLVKRSQQGDQLAMDTLIIKYQDRIYSAILKICPNSDDAAELTQDTFVKVIENIDEFRLQSTFYTWIFRIAMNLAMNCAKRKLKIGFRSLEDTLSGCSDDSRLTLRNYLNDDGENDPVKMLQNAEIVDIMTAAINKLDEDHRAVVVLRDIELMSYDQIAEVLGLELGTVKSRLFRARENLRDILAEAIL